MYLLQVWVYFVFTVAHFFLPGQLEMVTKLRQKQHFMQDDLCVQQKNRSWKKPAGVTNQSFVHLFPSAERKKWNNFTKTPDVHILEHQVTHWFQDSNVKVLISHSTVSVCLF